MLLLQLPFRGGLSHLPPDAVGSALLIFTFAPPRPRPRTPRRGFHAPAAPGIATLLDRESTAQSPPQGLANPPYFAEIILNFVRRQGIRSM